MERIMRTLEVRRHAERAKPGQHLNQAGVDLARRVGQSMGKFDRVVTSILLRALETAIAMGYAVDEQLEVLNTPGNDVDAEINWDAGFTEWVRVVKQGGAAAHFAKIQAKAWRSIVNSLPKNGRALIITHGGFIEAGAAALLPHDVVSKLGSFCNYCEGVRLTFDGDEVNNIEILRVE
jgi:broad specificity phosphatase PhoE